VRERIRNPLRPSRWRAEWVVWQSATVPARRIRALGHKRFGRTNRIPFPSKCAHQFAGIAIGILHRIDTAATFTFL